MQTIFPVAILFFQLDERLRIRGAVHFDTAFGPLARDIVVFRLDWL